MKKKRRYIDDDEQRATTLVDPQLERALIVAMLGHLAATGYVMTMRSWLTDEDFTDEDNRNVWLWCKECVDEGREVNMLNIYAMAESKGGKFEVNRYVQANGSDGDPMALAAALHNMGVKRRISEGVQDVLMSIEHDPTYRPSDAVAELEAVVDSTTKTIKPKSMVWGKLLREILAETERRQRGEMPQGTMTGFDIIDRKGGMERGELMVIAGRNSNGKTSFALCCAVECAKRGTPVGIFSLEMTNRQLGSRIASILSGVNGEQIKRGQLVEHEWDALVNVDTTLQIHFDDVRTADIDPLIANIKAMVAQKGVQVVVIDYLQLLRSRESVRHQQMANVAHRLEALSKQLEITIVLLSQLRRNLDKDPTPRMEELKESGDIADAADSVYLVYRPERHGPEFRYPALSKDWSNVSTKDTAMIMCCKNRNGALDGEQVVGFDAATTRFYKIDHYAPYTASGAAAEYNTPF